METDAQLPPATAQLTEAQAEAQVEQLRAVFNKHLGPRRDKPTRKQIETTLDVLAWLASGDQDPGMKDDIAAVRMLLDTLLDVGW